MLLYFPVNLQFHDKMDTMLENLERVAQRLRVPPPIPADSDKIREQIGETKSAMLEFQKLQPTFTSLNSSGQELIMLSRKEQKEEMAKGLNRESPLVEQCPVLFVIIQMLRLLFIQILSLYDWSNILFLFDIALILFPDIQGRLSSMQDLWGEIEQQTENHETRLVEVLDLADRFWANLAAALSSLQEQEGDLYLVETLGVDPSLIKQQEEILLAKREDLDCFQEDLEMLRYLGSKLISACGEPDKPEVKKSIDEVNVAWERLNKLVQGRMDKLDEAMRITLQYQDSLQNTFDWLENKLTYFDNLAPVGTELEIVKQQMDDLNKVKVESYQQQIEMERLSHQGEIMLRKVKEEQQRAVITGPLKDLKEQWESLDSKILNRQHKLETSLLALGQFQHTLEELFTWLGHTEGLLSEQNPVVNDPKAIEIELAKHLVLRNDVFAHKATVATVKQAGAEIVRSSDGGEVATLQNRLQSLQQRWDSVMLCTEQRRAELDKALQQARGFQGEVEALMQWLADLEGLLSDSQPVGGLPETAKEQLNAHLQLCQEYEGQQVVYRRALEHCQLVEREGEGELGKRASIQDLEQKWRVVGNKLEERKTKLEAALKTAIDFHNSLQDLISWLTQTENALNLMSTPSLILDSVLFQIDGHKMLANEVNSRREQVVDLDKTGTHLKYFSRKQDVALIKNLMQSVQTRWECVLHGTLNRGRALDDARKRAKQFHEVWTKLMDWLEEAEKGLDLEPDCSNDPEKIKVQLSKHKEFQKTMGGKQPAYDTATRMGRVLNEKATLLDDEQGLEMMLSELRDKWDTVCGKSVERQHKLEEALLFSGQFAEALQVLIDWLYKVEPLLAEEQPVHGDVALVITLIEGHKAFQKELGKRASSVQALKRSTRDLEDGSNAGDQSWVHAQMAELSSQWESVCKLSLQKQGRLDAALKQAEEFRMLGQGIMDWLAEAEKTLRFHGILPEEVEAVQLLIEQHKEFLERLEEQQTEVNRAVTMGETILAVCHPDSSTTIKQWINIIRSRFEEVIMWARQHQVRLETSLNELLSNSRLLEDMLSWLQQAQEMIRQRDQESLPEQIDSLQYLISEHQTFMEEMMSKQPEMERMTKSYKRKPSVSDVQLFDRIRSRKRGAPPLGVVPTHAQPLETKNPRVTQLFNKWRQVWLMALERQRKLQDCLERLQELKDFESFDFDVWRRKYMQWMNHKKSRVMDFFRRIDKDQDGKITRQEFIDGILSSRFPTNRLEMVAVADIFDRDRDGYIDYYEFIAALHPNKDAYRPITDADKIEDEVTRQVAECKCTRRFQVEQIGENKYRFYLGNQFGDSQQLRLVRILRSTVMVRVGGGWMALDEFLVKNDPCRAKGRTNLELREKFIMPEGASQSMAPFRTRGRRSRPTSRTTSPVRGPHVHSSSCTTPSSTSSTTANTPRPSSATLSRNYDKPWLSNSRTSTPTKPLSQESDASPVEVTPIHGSRLRPPGYLSGKSLHVGEDSLTLDSTSDLHILQAFDMSRSPSRGGSRPGSRPGSRTSSRRGSESSDLDVPERANLATDGTEGLGGVDALGGSRPASRADKTTKIPKGAGSGTSNKLTRR
uniref:Dystonin n=1 Tax=Eptatretus burgeri TaxID=7764 RepID=A0A8C4R0E0_EPTBU